MNTNIRKKTIAAGLSALLFMTGCAGKTPAQTEPLKHDPAVKTELKLDQVANQKFDENKLNGEYGRYSFEMMKQIAANAEKNCNIMISPASIMMALDMCAAGAKAETLKQLSDLFAKDVDPLEQQAFASEMMKRFNASQKIKFNCANAVWSNDKILNGKVNTTYTDYIKKTFEAEFNAVKFGPSTHKEINKWVDDKTNHMIPELLNQPLTEDAIMVLVNAIRFEAQWAKGYEDGQVMNMEFNGINGETDASMLSSTEKGYFETDKATGFIKYYEGEEYAFVAILPKDTKAEANDFMKSFTYEDYKKFIDSRSDEDVRALMPEFKSDYGNKLNETVAKLGVTDAFDQDKADFSGIADTKDGNFYISEIIHKTHIEVDRKGTKAAAATAVTMKVAGVAPARKIKEVICNRPYCYAIVDTVSMNPIFIGTVNTVK
ncbi:MAG: serpin family protein [Clostridiales bacterium]|nr:serpin family protein [Clostridiales bacterium]MBR6487531.1 serpin family protein [Clostridiales bacterium]